MTLAGVDVSVYQDQVGQWDKAAGISFMAARATLGLTYADPFYKGNIAGAKAAGIIPGAYHYLTSESGLKQAERFLSVIGDPDGLLIQLDAERSGVTYAVIAAFVARWNELVTHPIFLYGNPSFMGKMLHDLDNLGPWWMADYPGGSGYPGDAAPQWKLGIAGWTHPTVWQWGPIHTPAFPHPVDGDAFRGTRDELLAYTKTGGALTFPISNEIPQIATIPAGRQLYNLNGTALVKSPAYSSLSPYETTIGTTKFRAVTITTAGVHQLALVATADVTLQSIPPTVDPAAQKAVGQIKAIQGVLAS